MTNDQARAEVIAFWLGRSDEAVASELAAGRGYAKRVFENRRSGDYQELFVFDATHANALCEEATGFVAQMRRLLSHDQEA